MLLLCLQIITLCYHLLFVNSFSVISTKRRWNYYYNYNYSTNPTTTELCMVDYLSSLSSSPPQPPSSSDSTSASSSGPSYLSSLSSTTTNPLESPTTPPQPSPPHPQMNTPPPPPLNSKKSSRQEEYKELAYTEFVNNIEDVTTNFVKSMNEAVQVLNQSTDTISTSIRQSSATLAAGSIISNAELSEEELEERLNLLKQNRQNRSGATSDYVSDIYASAAPSPSSSVGDLPPLRSAEELRMIADKAEYEATQAEERRMAAIKAMEEANNRIVLLQQQQQVNGAIQAPWGITAPTVEDQVAQERQQQRQEQLAIEMDQQRRLMEMEREAAIKREARVVEELSSMPISITPPPLENNNAPPPTTTISPDNDNLPPWFAIVEEKGSTTANPPPIYAATNTPPTNPTNFFMETALKSQQQQPNYNQYKRDFPYPMDQSYIPKGYNPTTLTQQLIKQSSQESSYERLFQMEVSFSQLKSSTYIDQLLKSATRKTKFVSSDGVEGSKEAWDVLRTIPSVEYDLIISGGTTGIFYAATILLQNNDWKIAVIDDSTVRGDDLDQEWILSRKELMELVHLGLLTEEDMEYVIVTEFEGCRSGFKNKEVSPLAGGYFDNDQVGYECFTPNVYNIGISPKRLLNLITTKFQELGGTILQNTSLQNIVISESKGAALTLLSEDQQNIVTSRLILDCMGNTNSPIQKQKNDGAKPDSICVMVGSCASGYDPNTNKVGDIIYTNTGIQDKESEGKYQYFWQSFPVGVKPNSKEESNTKTTYMYTYLDAEEYHPSISTFLEEYWKFLPYYQQSITNPRDDLDVHRLSYAYFPTYSNNNSPFQPQTPSSTISRILSIGESSSSIMQSPLLGGFFGKTVKNLGRISRSIDEALQIGCLHHDDLSLINPSYKPNQSLSGILQKAMIIKQNQNNIDPAFINRLLATNFQIMEEGDITPYLQDNIRLDGMINNLLSIFIRDPTFVPAIIQHVGIYTILSWLGDVGMLALYTTLHTFVSPVLDTMVDNKVLFKEDKDIFYTKRYMDAWKYGSGCDYIYEFNDEDEEYEDYID